MRIQLKDAVVDLERRVVQRKDRVEPLTVLEEGLLRFLVAHRGRVVTRAELLENVWGYRPGVMSDAVKLTVFRLRKKLERDPKAPDHLLAARGSGYRFELDEAPELGVGRTLDGTTNLPESRNRFFGRADEASRLAALLETRLAVVAGSGGMGKTRLALEVGRRWLEGGPTRQCWFIDLSSVETGAEVPRAVATALGLSADELSNDEAIASFLDRPEALFVLDQAERVKDPLAAYLEVWLQKAPSSRFVVTSREALAVAPAAHLELGPLAEPEAVSLFEDRALTAGRSVEGDPAVSRIVALVDGIPLAVELAAGRVVALSPADIASRLEEPFRILRSTGSDRHASLWSAIDGSWQLLDEDEQRAWAQCGVFAGSFDLAAAEAVLDGPVWAGDLLQNLCRKHVVRTVEAAGRIRFSLLVPLWQYVRRRLEELPGADEARERHARYYAELGSAPDLDLVQVVPERDNLLAAHRWASTTAPGLAARLALALVPLFTTEGPLATGLVLAESSLRDPAVDASLRSRLLSKLAYLSWVAGDLAQAIAQAEEARRGATSPQEEAEALLIEAIARFVHSRSWDEAHALLETALVKAKGGPRAVEGRIFEGLGRIASGTGREEEADAWLARALQTQRESGDRLAEASVLMIVGVRAGRAGNWARAQGHYAAAAETFRALGDLRREGVALAHAADALHHLGDVPGAREADAEALRIAIACGDWVTQAQVHETLAQAAFGAGHPDEGNRNLAKAVGLYRRWGRPRAAIRILVPEALRALEDGRIADATAHAAEIEATTELDWDQEHAFLAVILGRLALVRGNAASARARLEEARSTARAVVSWPDLSIADAIATLEASIPGV